MGVRYYPTVASPSSTPILIAYFLPSKALTANWPACRKDVGLSIPWDCRRGVTAELKDTPAQAKPCRICLL
jgi:hypothetical protein